MSKKIEGYGANRFGEYQFDVAPDENDGWQRATLVIGERAFTESEVRAMLDELRDAAGHDAIDGAMKEVGIDPS